jgi:hypothetical protein
MGRLILAVIVFCELVFIWSGLRYVGRTLEMPAREPIHEERNYTLETIRALNPPPIQAAPRYPSMHSGPISSRTIVNSVPAPTPED